MGYWREQLVKGEEVNTLYITKGIPGSGKTTKSKEFAAKSKQPVTLVSKDDLREMMHLGKWSKANEKQVIRVRDGIVTDALYNQRSIVVHDTNLAPQHETVLRNLAKTYGAEFEIWDFTDVPLETCLERDARRDKSVGRKVIEDMYYKYVYVAPEPPAHDSSKPDAVLCDLDGTLAHTLGERSMYDDTGACATDTCDERVAELLRFYNGAGYEILIVSARHATDANFDATYKWLQDHSIPFEKLIMRKEGDSRPDDIVKTELYFNEIAPSYNVRAVFDDRKKVKRSWVKLGLFVLDVNQTDREF
jgi:predicted kinase